MDALSTSWKWRSSDSILHTLPLHHIHGLVNALMCAHYNGALVEFLPFSGRLVWARLLEGRHTVFMGVPSSYKHLVQVWNPGLHCMYTHLVQVWNPGLHGQATQQHADVG
jgi:malonyl-CoA/methylmalonyl-CoA synthetase